MKRFLLMICCISITSFTYAQAIGYGQLQKAFTLWLQSNGTSVKEINNQLKAISSKWKIKSFSPSVDGYFKSYFWYNINAKGDTTELMVSNEERNESNKFTLIYAFHNKLLYNEIVQNIKTSAYYKDNITTFTDNSKGEMDLEGHPDESLPISKRIDLILTDYNLNSGVDQSRLYSIDIYSRYIPK